MDNKEINAWIAKHEGVNDKEIGLRVSETRMVLQELFIARHERDQADRRAGAAERKLEQASRDYVNARETHREVAKTVWATHEKQFRELTKERDEWKERFEEYQQRLAAVLTRAEGHDFDRSTLGYGIASCPTLTAVENLIAERAELKLKHKQLEERFEALDRASQEKIAGLTESLGKAYHRTE